MLRRAVVLLALSFVQAAAFAAEDVGSVAEELRVDTQSLLDSVAPGDRSAWEQRLHSDFIRLDENGGVTNAAEFLAEIKPLPAGLDGRMEIEEFTVSANGRTAITTYKIQEYLDYFGQPLRSRFRSMDTWIETPDGWRLLGQHVAAELKDPPAISAPQEILCAYEGVYELTQEISTTISCAEDSLRAVRDGRPDTTYLAETEAVFFVAGRPRTRRIFLRGDDGSVTGFVDRREGEDVYWRFQNRRRLGELCALRERP